jgi:hypothetical protein
MTVARAYSATVVGLDGVPVVVECAVGAGLPGLTLVGLPDAAVKESRERIRSSIPSCSRSAVKPSSAALRSWLRICKTRYGKR